MRSDIAQGNGMYKSTDGGKTWAHIGLARLAADRAHPRRSARTRTSSTSPRSAIRTGPNAERGVFRSQRRRRDAGRRSSATDDDTGAIDLAFEPGNPSVIYAALWQTRRTPWSVYPPSNGPGSGLYKSTDGGDTGRELTGNGLPGEARAASASPSRRRSRSASTRSSTPTATAASTAPTTRGATWTRASGDTPHLGARLVLRRRHRRAEERRRRLLAATSTSTARTTAARPSCRSRARRAATTTTQLWIDPRASGAPHPRRRSGRGRVASTAARRGAPGTTSRPASSTTSSPTTAFPYWVYGAQQDSGAAGVPSRTNTIDGITMIELPRDHRRRRERQHRARPEGPGHHLRRPRRQARPAHAARRSRSIRRSPIPATTAATLDAAAGLLAARSARPLLRATSGSSAPRTAASTGR